LAVTLNRERDAIDEALDSFGPAIEVLDQQHDDLVRLLRALDRLGKISTKVVRTSGDNLVEAMRLLKPVLRELADAGDSLPRGLMMLASFPFPKESADLARGNYSNALFHLELDLNKAVQGILTGGDTGLPQLLQICQNYSPDCKKLQPLADALCQLTGQDLACSVATVQAAGAASVKKVTGAKSSASGASPPKGTGPLPNVLPSAAPVNPVNDLVGQLNRVIGSLGGAK
jgi:phospholipid/cholesterol/gamma-HCH transport system substrate-binding protein